MRRFSFQGAPVRPSSPVGALAGRGVLPAAGPEELVRGLAGACATRAHLCGNNGRQIPKD